MEAAVQYYIVDAFTTQPWQGNPAAVVLSSAELHEGYRVRIAMSIFLLSFSLLSTC